MMRSHIATEHIKFEERMDLKKIKRMALFFQDQKLSTKHTTALLLLVTVAGIQPSRPKLYCSKQYAFSALIPLISSQRSLLSSDLLPE